MRRYVRVSSRVVGTSITNDRTICALVFIDSGIGISVIALCKRLGSSAGVIGWRLAVKGGSMIPPSHSCLNNLPIPTWAAIRGSTRHHILGNLDKSPAILAGNVVFWREYLGFDHREDAVKDIVRVNLSRYSLFTNFVAGRQNFFVGDGY